MIFVPRERERIIDDTDWNRIVYLQNFIPTMVTKLILIASLFVQTLCLVSLVTLADGFSVHRASSSQSAMFRNHRSNELPYRGMLSEQRRKMKVKNSSIILMNEPSSQETTSAPEKENEPQSLGRKKDQPLDVKDTVRTVGRKVGKAALYGFSYFMNVVGLYFAFGILLNVFGYAYEFSFKEGYKIDTIKDKRIELQFERESKRYEKERNDRLTKFSIGAAANRLGSDTVVELMGSTNLAE